MSFSLSRPIGVFILCAGGFGVATPVAAQNLVVDGSLCVGLDCPASPTFSFDTIRLQENNLRIKFMDTSSTGSFPQNDWQIRANSSTNGGANAFFIDDMGTANTNGQTPESTPFTIEANAGSNAFYIDDGERVGLGTSSPAVELHIVDGDTPTVRLAQDGSSGFEPQTWDIAGNETNFFVRDVTNGSTLPLRIRPGAPSSSIFIDTDGDVGLGDTSPDATLHVHRTSAASSVLIEAGGTGNDASFVLKQAGATPVEWEFRNQAGSGRLNVGIVGGNTPLKIDDGADNNLLKLGDDTNSDAVIVTGQLIVNGTPLNVPDYVFEEGYALRPLSEVAAFIADNGHLPGVPSATQINTELRFNVVDMQLTLLEKLEELTLYTLAQEDMIAGLRSEIELLKASD